MNNRIIEFMSGHDLHVLAENTEEIKYFLEDFAKYIARDCITCIEKTRGDLAKSVLLIIDEYEL